MQLSDLLIHIEMMSQHLSVWWNQGVTACHRSCHMAHQSSRQLQPSYWSHTADKPLAEEATQILPLKHTHRYTINIHILFELWGSFLSSLNLLHLNMPSNTMITTKMIKSQNTQTTNTVPILVGQCWQLLWFIFLFLSKAPLFIDSVHICHQNTDRRL